MKFSRAKYFHSPSKFQYKFQTNSQLWYSNEKLYTLNWTIQKREDILILVYYMAHFRFGSSAKVVHFLGKTKPWSYTFDITAKRITGSVPEASTHSTFLLDWWTLYSSAVVPMLHEHYGEQPFHSGCVEVNKPASLQLQLPTFWVKSPHGVAWKKNFTIA